MIERYSRPEMRALWEPETRLRRMLEVEAVFLEEIAGRKGIPARQIRAMRSYLSGCGPLAEKVARREAVSGHDVVALLQVVSDALKSRAPAVVQYLHYGLTSSDVLDTALALQLKDAIALLLSGWRTAAEGLRGLGKRERGAWMAGRTHGVHAEPLLFSYKIAGWHSEAKRNLSRLERAGQTVGYGKLSGAIGTYAHLSPALEARVLKRLGLRPEPVATQVVPRDRHAEYVQALALSGCAVERIATEIRHLQRTEVLEAEEPFGKGQKGSSAMPHKRNPILCENLCGLARLLRGYAAASLENVALWHERDISHSSAERVLLPDATIALDFMLHRLARVIGGLVVYPDRMRRNLDHSMGLVFSQKVLLALIDKGVDRMTAYDLVQRCSMETWRSRGRFEDALRSDPGVREVLSPREIAACFDLEAYGRWPREVLGKELR
jgi:adenylosuccinate lyase